MDCMYRGVYYTLGTKEPKINPVGTAGRYRGLPIQLCRDTTPVNNQHLAMVYRGIRYDA